jgi:flagellar biosynthesis protein FliQ
MTLSQLLTEACWVLLWLAGPALAGALTGGLLAGLFEAKTQVRATTLSLALRLLLGGVALVLSEPYFLPRLKHLAELALAFAKVGKP